MQLKQLAYFVAVVEHGSFSRAAANLYLTQSSLSQSVQALEQELGFKLLKRSRDGVVMTEMGEMVYAGIKDLLFSVDRLTESWKQAYRARCSLDGLIRIATVPGAHPILMDRVLSRVREAYPNIRYKVLEARGPLLPTYLAEGKVDLILSDFIEARRADMESFFQAHDLVCVELRSDTYKIAVGASRLLARKTELQAEDAGDIPLACYFGGDDAAELYFDRFFDRDLIVEYTSIEKMVQEAINGPGVSVLPELTIRSTYPDALRFLTVEGFCVPFVHYVGFRQDTPKSQEINVVLRVIQRVFSDELK